MINQRDVDTAINGMKGANNGGFGPYDAAFIEYVRVQTQLMLEMRDLLARQESTLQIISGQLDRVNAIIA